MTLLTNYTWTAALCRNDTGCGPTSIDTKLVQLPAYRPLYYVCQLSIAG